MQYSLFGDRAWIEMPTLYDKLGGRKVLEKIVADFYQTILNDDDLNIFYL